MVTPISEMLRHVSLFADLSEIDLGALVALGQVSTAAKDTLLCVEGELGDEMHVIIEGTVRVYQTHGDAQHDLAVLNPGDYFGEMALIDRAPCAASVTALEQCQLFGLDRELFVDALTRIPQLLHTFLVDFTQKVRASNGKMLELAFESERRKAAAEIERHKAISQMVAGVAHEINTPLGIINQAASMMSETINARTYDDLAKDDDARQELVDVADAAKLILSNSERARRLVTSFKDLSVRQVTDSKEIVDIEELLREVAGLYRFQARANKLKVTIEDALGDGDRQWHGYPGYFSQIILNLISNVDRYAYVDGEGGPVDILLSRTGSGYRIAVTDRGVGIPAKHVPDVCTPFFTTGRGKGGTGLGMAIVYNLVTTALEGTLDIQSTEGEGTCVTFTLPSVVVGTALAAPGN